ncbi:MAG TPA: Gfo/Idh/MocA family oxidoreductase [Candidatus Sumerlaeota bacterium]|nr:Gfo/Idh/MocA family oxidoreductase [Candidatus Sumerlaeota bacterium]
MTPTQIKWGIISTGRIASIFARQLPMSRTGILTAVASRDRGKAEKFACEYKVFRAHGSYEDLLADPDIQAVYIATPHPMHAEWAVRCAEAGKHILCEKPITMNRSEAETVIIAARRSGVFLMEAFHYRCHPQTAKIIELIRQKIIGDVCAIQAAFSFRAPYDLNHRTLNQALGGGGILDVGCYCVSMARLIAGTAAGNDFAEPLEVKGCAMIGHESRVDEYAVASMKFPGGILAELACGCRVRQDNVVRIYGTEGSLYIPAPWVVSIDGGVSKIIVTREDEKTPREVEVFADRGLFAIEADTVAEYISRHQAMPPAMSWDDTLGNMRALDLWRESIGLVYDTEKQGAGPV